METLIKKQNRPIIMAVAITGLMAITNPSKESYLEHLTWQLKDSACQQQQLSCTTLKNVPPGVSAAMLSSYTRRQNFLLFSIYTTDFYGVHDQTIGLGGFFL